MASKGCVTRLQKEYKSLLREPVPHVTAHPTSNNLLEWHFVLEGASGTDYEGGVYHGRLVFPPNYPFKPPSISMLTPNGRFAINTKLCLSITDYHPESWNPMWSVGTILTGLMSFMCDNQPTTGSITTTKADKQRMARESLAFNSRNPTFKKLFPEWVEEFTRRQQRAAAPPPPPLPSGRQPGVAAAAQSQQLPWQRHARQQPAQQAQIGLDQQQQQRPGAPLRGGGGAGAAGSRMFTAAVVVLVLAIAVFPLCSSDMRASLALLRGRLFSPGDGL